MATATRIIRAPRGTSLTCKGWPQEAALRMLMNNLDPEVAENPDELVVYGGIGRAARNWECFDRIVDSLRALQPDETLLIQSGKKLLEVTNPLQKWGLAVAARRGRNKAAVAVARKLCVAVWHILMGHVIGALERLDTLETKLGKFATEIGPAALSAFGYNNKADFVQKKLYVLRSYP